MALDGLTPFLGFCEQIGMRHNLVDQADIDGFLGRESAGEEDHLAGQTLANHAGNVLGRTYGRAGANFGTGLAEMGLVGSDHHVTPQGELVSATHAPAIDHGDDRDWQAANGHGRAEHPVVPVIGVGPVQLHHRAEIAASREGLVACAGDNGTSDRRVVAGRFEGVDQLVERVLTKGIA